MALSQINNYGVGDNNFTSFQETLDATRRGMAEITLSNYDNDSAPDVKVGSVFENNGAFFQVTTSDITPTGYSGISNSTTFYLYFDESATAFIYSSTAPTWNDARQGWYNSDDRAFFSMFKDSGGTLYQNKRVLLNYSKTAFTTYTTTIALSNELLDQSVNIDSTGGDEDSGIYYYFKSDGNVNVRTKARIEPGGTGTGQVKIYKNGVLATTVNITRNDGQQLDNNNLSVRKGDYLQIFYNENTASPNMIYQGISIYADGAGWVKAEIGAGSRNISTDF